MTVTTRERMIASAASVLAERGFEAASFTEIMQRAGVTRGVIYHHFPGGKFELVIEALDATGRAAEALLKAARAGDDPLGAMRAFVDLWAENLQSSNFRSGCPVVAVVADAPADPELLDAADRAFGLWHQALADTLINGGVDSDRANTLATVIISSVEGAVVLCRAQRNSRPLTHVKDELERLLHAAIPS
ncbi:TetR/AcrR family transcriptional regulator [Nocardia bovistercoris]|uniref:TetR/AcrR family transcriptional regulator n=1 Tax=Nocardia bovistercoris TaxID=2785916 RepID=A0A931I7X4_9NOCA|nr:TetR/AcrR family transcriptional regulator [Nocardia bovistercoris]MBH0775038.1 TetR/AcrR family transcriptional regulator [Nocardia bovistercoris]